MTCKYLTPKQVVCGFELPHAEMLTAAQVSAILDCSDEHIYNLCNAREMESIRINNGKKSLHRIPRKSLVSFIEERTTGPVAEVDFSATEAPFGLAMPKGRILRSAQVAGLLRCSQQHVSNLIDAWELLATKISSSERANVSYRIPRSGLIHFLNTRTEGAC